jgi:hypothetical protein
MPGSLGEEIGEGAFSEAHAAREGTRGPIAMYHSPPPSSDTHGFDGYPEFLSDKSATGSAAPYQGFTIAITVLSERAAAASTTTNPDIGDHNALPVEEYDVRGSTPDAFEDDCAICLQCDSNYIGVANQHAFKRRVERKQITGAKRELYCLLGCLARRCRQ